MITSIAGICRSSPLHNIAVTGILKGMVVEEIFISGSPSGSGNFAGIHRERHPQVDFIQLRYSQFRHGFIAGAVPMEKL